MASVTMRGEEWVGELLAGMLLGFDTPGGRRLADEIAEILERQIKEHRRKGLKADGSDQPAIKESTHAWRRRAGKGDGPPIAPDGDTSRVVALLDVEKEVTADRIHVAATYPPDFQAILDKLAEGAPPLAGPRPTKQVPLAAKREIARAVAGVWWIPEGVPPGHA